MEATLAATPGTPVAVAALRPAAFALAGELADGAISWVCPIDYLLTEAKPAMARGAAKAGRAVPPLFAHVPVVVASDHDTILARAREQLAFYATLPAESEMFAKAGYPIPAGGDVPDALIDALVVGGDEAAIAAGLRERLGRLDRGDELVVGLLAGPDRRVEEDLLLRILPRL